MINRDALAKLIFSPWKVMVISVLVSEVFYLLISVLLGQEILPFGVIISAVIPALVSYPISYLIIRYHEKIEDQRKELERLNELNNRLFSIIAHDIRSPISGVYGILDLIKIEALSKQELSEYISDLSLTVDNLLSFLDDILQWSKGQIDKKEIEPALFNSKKTWDQVLALYAHNIKAKNIEIVSSDLERQVFADEGSYSFIVRNILQNAIKFTPQNGTIEIKAEEKENRIITTIQDNGIGISKENLDKILYSKEWVTTLGTENEKGTGFGLKASAKYVEILEGNFHIESAPGQGTKVTIDLPGGNGFS